MSKSKTTVYLDDESYRRLKEIGKATGRAPAELVREAVVEYAARHSPRPAPRSVAGFASGRPDLGSGAEDLLRGFGEDGA